MRKLRIIGKPGSKYHVISRFVDRQFATGDRESKKIFHHMMVSQAGFSGVEILTFCIMGNHFHLLLRVPERPVTIPEQEVLKRLRKIWKPHRVEELIKRFERMRLISVEGDALVERELDRFRRRMFDLSQYVKELKQRFSTWFNFTHNRKGTLFEERFKSVLVEDGHALRLMAAYIDLNPVRAGIVEDPVDYKWCGYAAAVGGNQDRRRGLQSILSDPNDQRPANDPERVKAQQWRTIHKRYRRWLFERGRETHHRDGRQKKRGFSRAESMAAWANWDSESAIPPAKLLRCKARYLTDSVACGSKTFIEQTIALRFSELKARHPKAHEGPAGICTLINLKGNRTS